MQDPPAADRESFFKPLFLTEALRPPKNPRKTGELIYLVHADSRWCCNIQQTLLILWVSHYGVGLSLVGGHAYIGSWGNTQ